MTLVTVFTCSEFSQALSPCRLQWDRREYRTDTRIHCLPVLIELASREDRCRYQCPPSSSPECMLGGITYHGPLVS